jgi:hypothetical protein
MYRDANGIEHDSYDEACHYYGAETKASMEMEARAEREEYEAWALAHPEEAAAEKAAYEASLNDCPF